MMLALLKVSVLVTCYRGEGLNYRIRTHAMPLSNILLWQHPTIVAEFWSLLCLKLPLALVSLLGASLADDGMHDLGLVGIDRHIRQGVPERELMQPLLVHLMTIQRLNRLKVGRSLLGLPYRSAMSTLGPLQSGRQSSDLRR